MRQFSQILQNPQQSNERGKPFSALTPFKVQVNFDIPNFEGKIDADVVEDWITKLERYFFVNTFSNVEKITFSLLKFEAHVKQSWENKITAKNLENGLNGIIDDDHTWNKFFEFIKEEYFRKGTYEEKYMEWQLLQKKNDQTIQHYTNKFHALLTKLGIHDSEKHRVLKYRSELHRYIQTKMYFLNIETLGIAYKYATKIEEKFKQKGKKDFFTNNKFKGENSNKFAGKQAATSKCVSQSPTWSTRTKKTPKYMGMWCDVHKSSRHDIKDYRAAKTLMTETHGLEQEAGMLPIDSFEQKSGETIIEADPCAIVAIAKVIHREDEEHLFHSRFG